MLQTEAQALFPQRLAENTRRGVRFELGRRDQRQGGSQDMAAERILVDGIERQATPWPDWAVTTVVDTSDVVDQVWRAVSCHQTQMGVYQQLADLPAELHRSLWGSQEFYRAFSLVNGGRAVESDIFEGLRHESN